MNRTANPKTRRRGFTLVELLVVIGVIGFMVGMITYALLGAQTDARVARTRSTIQKLNEVILQQWEEYRYRPVDLRKGSFTNGSIFGQPLPRTQTFLRTAILRDTMRMEMPDRVADLLFGPSQYVVAANMPSAAVSQAGWYLGARAYPLKFNTLYSSLYQAIVNSASPTVVAARASYPLVSIDTLSLDGIEASLGPAPALFSGNATDGLAVWDSVVQSSELLYLIVSTANYGGTPALEMFRASEIGDPDGDGLLEFIDAWGRPIRWIRWPVGHPSDLNRYANTDAMDPLRTDWRYANPTFDETTRPQTIVPLIVSGGSDELFGNTFEFYDTSASPAIPTTVYARMRQGSGNNQFCVDPFFVFVNGGPNNDSAPANLLPSPMGLLPYSANRLNQLGSIAPSSAAFAVDDITNHDLILEP